MQHIKGLCVHLGQQGTPERENLTLNHQREREEGGFGVGQRGRCVMVACCWPTYVQCSSYIPPAINCTTQTHRAWRWKLPAATRERLRLGGINVNDFPPSSSRAFVFLRSPPHNLHPSPPHCDCRERATICPASILTCASPGRSSPWTHSSATD